LNIAISNSLPQISLENATRLLDLHHFDVLRAHLDMISDGENGDVTMIRVLVSPMDRHRPDKELFRSSFVTPDGQGSRDDIFQFLKRELKRTKWLDPETMDLVFDRYPWLGVRRGEIITGFCSLMHPIMSKINPLAFSKTSIFHTVTKKRYIGHASAIVDLFLDRFHPTQRISQEDFESQRARLHEVIEAEVEDTMAAGLLYKMLEIVSHSLKTNIFMENRYAFGIRLDPSIMVAEQGEDRELPYGILFAHGRRFNGYHVRFRDISRGGMRLVTPPNGEQYALESARQYDECYGLAFAQQLKNKDIPEGGSKAVVLIDVDSLSLSAKNFVMR
jgi:glutamate dehydrogenase